jgi:hypothetical protein
MSNFIVILSLLAFGGIYSESLSYSLENQAIQPISDTDFNHLKTAPSLNWGTNPFSRKPGYVTIDPAIDEISVEHFHLGGIIYDKMDPVAIINGQTVGIGDPIDGLEVEAIAPNYVIIRGEGNHFELSLATPKEAKHTAEIRPYIPSRSEKSQ